MQQPDAIPVDITIRGVPEALRDKLAARAASSGRSLVGFLRDELERIASRPAISTWLAAVRDRKARTQTRVSPVDILRDRDADRA
ncbi:MAG: hypothetical protein OXO54_04575 [Chloroflexota bacterium]|nr:hypothetical protein [Chloroflexota bacterium]MDE2897578.1 hypothetical protein [Chloroflexota bacterium]